MDLWADQATPVGKLVAGSIVRAIEKWEGLGKKLTKAGLRKIKVYGVEVEASSTVATGTLAELLMQLNEMCGKKIVLIIDEAQPAVKTPQGIEVMAALKSARDQMNLSGEHRLAIVMTGSDRDKLCRLVNTNSSPFFGSHIEELPVLGEDYLVWVANQVQDLVEGVEVDIEVLADLFEALAWQPRELEKTLEPLVGFGRPEPGRFNDILVGITQEKKKALTQMWEDRFEAMNMAQRSVMHAVLTNASLGREIYTKRAKEVMRQVCGKDLSNGQIQKAITALRGGDSPMLWKSDRGNYALEERGMAQWHKTLVQQGRWLAVAKKGAKR